MDTDFHAFRKTETCIVTDGESIIDIRGTDREMGLLIANVPTALTWPDDDGTISNYLALSGVTRTDVSKNLRVIREVANFGVQRSLSLCEQVRPLLKLFSPGSYVLEFIYECRVMSHDDDWETEECLQKVGWSYPYSMCTDDEYDLLPTQTKDRLDEKRIIHFRKEVERGRRPVVFALGISGSPYAFIVDGHHKLHGYDYRASNDDRIILPSILLIFRVDPQPLTLTDGYRFLSQVKDSTYGEHYQDYKKRVATKYVR
ncbi:MAG: hypothetical protein K2W95_02545 [Candidatus Obscuribacterales bacterium]|nr:hypothetical protein [Candidatus Obscuribacterales bacterium]